MTHDEINTLHMSGTQFPLDSDEIDAALAHADLNPPHAHCGPRSLPAENTPMPRKRLGNSQLAAASATAAAHQSATATGARKSPEIFP